METKKMTLKEAQEFVRNTKYIVWSEDESRQLQKKLFEIGCGWFYGGQTVSHTENPFLLVDYKLRISYASKENYKCFEESSKTHQLKNDVLNIQIIEEPKPKFDLNTLKPFDKVLVRDCDDAKWACSIFSHVIHENEDRNFLCILSLWRHCIPYNEETKHLLGTCDEEPEFYKLD